jgi:hypothetical protein
MHFQYVCDGLTVYIVNEIYLTVYIVNEIYFSEEWIDVVMSRHCVGMSPSPHVMK